MSEIHTTRQLRSALKHWQKELGLQGWDISVGFLHPDKMDLKGADAETDWLLENQSAEIRIVRQKFNSKSIRQRLIHECLHCRLPLYPKETVAGKIFEAGIDAIADLLHRMSTIIEELEKERRRIYSNR